MSKTKVSFSALETFNQCPRKYYYNYVLELPKKQWPWLIFGNFVHLVLEKFHKYILYYKKRNKEIKYGYLMRRAFDSAMRYHNRIGKIISPETAEEARAILRVYLEDVRKECPDVLFVEKWFEIEVGDFLLRGAIDRVDKLSGNDFNIEDYKTSKKAFDVNKTHQVSLYSYALKKILEETGVKVGKISKSLNFLRFGKVRRAPHDEQKMDEAVAFVQEVGSKIKNNIETCKNEEDWTPIDNPFCRFCDFKDRCYKSRGMN